MSAPEEEEEKGEDVAAAPSLSAESRVVHLRSLPPKVTEDDIRTFAGVCDGAIDRIVLLAGRHVALVQFETLEDARAFMTHYTESPDACTISDKKVKVDYSKHTELTAPEEKPVVAVKSPPPPTPDARLTGPNSVLLVQINEHREHMIDTDVLFKAFARFGPVEKIVVFRGGPHIKALIQVSAVEAATTALTALQGKPLFEDETCVLDIQYSHLPSLRVRANSMRQRDYTNGALPWITVKGFGPPYDAVSPAVPPAGVREGEGRIIGGVVSVTGVPPTASNCRVLFNLFSQYGNIRRVRRDPPESAAYLQYETTAGVSRALHFLHGAALFGSQLSMSRSHLAVLDPVDAPSEIAEDFPPHVQRYKSEKPVLFRRVCAPTAVVHISNLPFSASEASVGSIVAHYRVPISVRLFVASGRKQALVHFGTVFEASDLVALAHNLLMDDRPMRLSFSPS